METEATETKTEHNDKEEEEEEELWIKRTDDISPPPPAVNKDLTDPLLANTNGCTPQEDGERVEENPSEDQSEKRCASLPLYIVNYSFLMLFYIAQNIYNIGVIRTVERKFGLRSAQSGLIMSMNDISHILVVIFVGYFGKKAHKPRFLSLSLLLCAFAALMMASPFAIFGSGAASAAPPTGGANRSSGYTAGPWSESESEPPSEYCDPLRPDHQCTDEEIKVDTANMAAYYIMMAAQFISGVGGSGVTTLGFSYIDENAPSHKSAMYIGIATSIMALAPVASLGLAALCLRLPENPFETTDLKPGDPHWIGCWWLGYVICSVALTATCIPMWFFPKHIKKIVKSEKQLKQSNMSIKEQMKEFPKSLGSLVKNVPYLMFIIAGVVQMYVVIGLYANLPRYIELHFFKPAFVASFIAISGAVSGVVGSFLGGYIVKKKKLPPRDASKIMIGGSAVFCLGIAVNMFLACPQLQMAGQWQDDGVFTVATQCNSNCSCPTSRSAYQPVCGEDQLTYFSPCHAACRESSNGSYSECSCIQTSNSTTLGGSVDPGRCHIECNTLLFYIMASFVFSLAGSISRAPGTIVLFRVVGDEQREFALGINSFVTNLLGCMPAPVVFGALVDTTCILWESKCTGTGSCLLYDSRKFRLRIHGSALFFDFFSVMCAVSIYYLIKDKHFPDKDDKATSEKNVNEKETSDGETSKKDEKIPLNDI
ncbi:hypothetical protein LSH36_35g02000 [Paralvinella palmiformis]|uniref:Solute carrier organic anion transporter family member n=1 Tax=Paralvinella palmiformis TaxID=53620 RepID=A0AAD9K809_9ANNE|nr:hypothetical protein LSH36_35g02000 [Paralvinella palmiformis]